MKQNKSKNLVLIITVVFALIFTASDFNGNPASEPTGIDNLYIEVYNPVTTINNSARNVAVNSHTYRAEDGRRLEYLYTFPNNPNYSSLKIVIVMHGNARNHTGAMNSFSYLSRVENICVIAPLFDAASYPSSRYHNVNIGSGTPYEEWTFNLLDSLFVDFVRRHNLTTDKYILYGHSAGAQFAHRTAMFSRSEYIDYVIAANAGTYTFLDEYINFNTGIKNVMAYKDTILSNLSGRKLYILTGSNDNDPNAADFTPTWQGNTRYEKALNFTRYALNYARVNGVYYNWETIIMDGVGHNQGQTRPYVLDIITGLYTSRSEQINARINGHVDAPIDRQSFRTALNMQMVFVEGGTFTMGATPEQYAGLPAGYEIPSNERTVHSVTLGSFQIGRFEVTQKQWKLVMGDYHNPSSRRGDNYPVESVSWDDVQTFITRLNNLTGMRYRLPTEAEWEFAARGGNQSRGYKYSGSNNIDDVAWYAGNRTGTGLNPVGSKMPNELGIYDMSGSVTEWVNDRFANYTSAAKTNPTGHSTNTNRVCRGGSFTSTAENCRVSRRTNNPPGAVYNNFGFRLALDN